MSSEWWENGKVCFALCSCKDGKHDQSHVYNTYEQERDAEQNKDEGEHIVLVRRYVKLVAITST